MNKKITLVLVALILVIGAGMMLASQPEGESSKKVTTIVVNAALVTDVEQFDFGIIDINGGTVSHEFPFTNTGTETITITDGTTSCACTSAEIEGVSFDMHNGMKSTVAIAPGETKVVTAVYDPLFHGPKGIGKITREVVLKTNSAVTPEVRARFKADVIKG